VPCPEWHEPYYVSVIPVPEIDGKNQQGSEYQPPQPPFTHAGKC